MHVSAVYLMKSLTLHNSCFMFQIDTTCRQTSLQALKEHAFLGSRFGLFFSNVVSFQPWGHKIHFSDVSSVIKSVLIFNNNSSKELIERFWKLKVLHNLKKNIQCANTNNYTNQWYTSVQNMKINKHFHIKHGTNTCIQDCTCVHTHTHTPKHGSFS